jgi:hypothetical protein
MGPSNPLAENFRLVLPDVMHISIALLKRWASSLGFLYPMLCGASATGSTELRA